MGSQVELKNEIPLLDLKRQYDSIKKDIDNAIKRVVDQQAFIMGSDVTGLEANISSYCTAKYGIGVSSGTDALMLALKSAGVGQGDEVITVPFTFIATAEAVSNVGAKPVFVDIDIKTYNMDVKLIEKKITKHTKAIIPVHLYGQCVDMDPLIAIAKKHGLKVIEDCAQALGALYKGKRAGSMGDAGCISFFPSKNLGGFGDGGMVVTNDKAIAESVRLLRVHGSAKRYVHSVIGYNSRLDNLQAAVLNVKLRELDSWIKGRIEKAAYLNNAFKSIGKIVTPFVPEYTNHTYHQYTIRVAKELRDPLIDHLVKNGIESRVYYPIPLHMQECYKFLGYKPEDMPMSYEASLTTLVLPVFPELNDNELNYIVDTVKDFFK